MLARRRLLSRVGSDRGRGAATSVSSRSWSAALSNSNGGDHPAAGRIDARHGVVAAAGHPYGLRADHGAALRGRRGRADRPSPVLPQGRPVGLHHSGGAGGPTGGHYGTAHADRAGAAATSGPATRAPATAAAAGAVRAGPRTATAARTTTRAVAGAAPVPPSPARRRAATADSRSPAVTARPVAVATAAAAASPGTSPPSCSAAPPRGRRHPVRLQAREAEPPVRMTAMQFVSALAIVWVSIDSGALVRVDPATGRVAASLQLPEAGSLAVTPNAV